MPIRVPACQSEVSLRFAPSVGEENPSVEDAVLRPLAGAFSDKEGVLQERVLAGLLTEWEGSKSRIIETASIKLFSKLEGVTWVTEGVIT